MDKEEGLFMNPLIENHNVILKEIEERMKYLEKEFKGCEEATIIIEEIQRNVKRLELLNK